MRHELGLSLEEAADRAGLKRPTWRAWERGLAKPRDMATVVRAIGEAFDYDELWLMWGGPLGAPGGPPSPDSDVTHRSPDGMSHRVVDIRPSEVKRATLSPIGDEKVA